MFARLNSRKRGLSFIEVLIVVAIIGILSSIVMVSWRSYTEGQMLGKDVEKVVEVLRYARSNTLASKNSSQYGIHLGSNSITLFSGSSYNESAVNNTVYTLNSSTALTHSLSGGSADVVFKRLTGEVTAYGTITLTSTKTGKTRNITIYKTGLVE